MKHTTLFLACGATLALSAMVLLRYTFAKTADPRTGGELEKSTDEPESWDQRGEIDFSADAFREELL